VSGRTAVDSMRAPVLQRAFGLTLRSNVPIPGLCALAENPLSSASPARSSASNAVDVMVGSLPRFADAALGSGATQVFPREDATATGYGLVVHDLGTGFHFRYEDDTRFLIEADGRRIWSTWQAPLTIDDMATYLLGPVMAFALRLRGVVSLHAGVVAHGQHAAALCGPAGAGKSTFIAAWARGGRPVLSDDLAPVTRHRDGFQVQPAGPRIRLWEASAEALFGRTDALPRLTPSWDKRYLDARLHGAFEPQSRPLRAVFVLEEREHSRRAPRLEPLSPRAAFVALIGNMHGTRIVPEHAQRAMFELARDLASALPVQRVVPHADFAHLPNLCDMVAEALQDC
jgi:hypothetical protein